MLLDLGNPVDDLKSIELTKMSLFFRGCYDVTYKIFSLLFPYFTLF